MPTQRWAVDVRGNISSADLAASWAREALTAKNNLTATDAKLVEDAFEQRLSQLGSSETATSFDDDGRGLKRQS
jgi:HSP90 family molecular chaperone